MPADVSLIQTEIHGARSPHSQAPLWPILTRSEAKWPHGARRLPFRDLFHRFIRSAIFGLPKLWVSPVGKGQFLRSGWRKRERHRELDGELLLLRAARARNVRRTKRRHGPRGPQVIPAALSLRPPLPAQAHPRPFFANSLRNCPFPPWAYRNRKGQEFRLTCNYPWLTIISVV